MGAASTTATLETPRPGNKWTTIQLAADTLGALIHSDCPASSKRVLQEQA